MKRACAMVMAVVLVVVCSVALAEAQGTGGFDRGWVDVNLGVAGAAEDGYGVEVQRTIFLETATFEAQYRFPTGASFDFGGGVMLSRMLGIGVSFAGTAHQDTAAVRATVPHPTRFNVPATDSAETAGQLTKVEGAAHIQLVLATMPSPRVRVRVFGGPSYFRVQQDTIDDIRYRQEFQVFGSNRITITDAPFSESEATAWGYHVGGDISWFFNRVVGIGGFGRFSRATVEQIDLGPSVVENKAGGFQAGGGLRLKF